MLSLRQSISKRILSTVGHPEAAPFVVPGENNNLLQEEHRSDMTNHPRYSPTPPPGRQPGMHGQVPPGPVGPQPSGPYEHQHYDWRYATEQQRQAFRAPYDPYRGAPMPVGPGQYPELGTPAGPQSQPRKRSRAAAFTAGAAAIAIVSAGIGGGVRCWCSLTTASPDKCLRRRARRACRQRADRLCRAGGRQGAPQRREAGK